MGLQRLNVASLAQRLHIANERFR